MSLATYRKNGASVATPVWFAQEGEKLFVLTIENSGKHKRLRNNPRVDLTPCTASGKTHGTSLQGMAQIHAAESEGGKQANAALTQKYGLFKRLFDLFHNLRGTKRVYLEIKAA
jgi:PPOX class probable F420-dependent enzyme